MLPVAYLVTIVRSNHVRLHMFPSGEQAAQGVYRGFDLVILPVSIYTLHETAGDPRQLAFPRYPPWINKGDNAHHAYYLALSLLRPHMYRITFLLWPYAYPDRSIDDDRVHSAVLKAPERIGGESKPDGLQHHQRCEGRMHKAV